MKLPLTTTDGLGAAIGQPLPLFERTEVLAIQPLPADKYRRTRDGLSLFSRGICAKAGSCHRSVDLQLQLRVARGKVLERDPRRLPHEFALEGTRHRQDPTYIQFRILTAIGQKTRELRLVQSVATEHQRLAVRPLFKEVIHAEIFKKT